MKTFKIALVRCPQPLLYGKETGSLYSPNRSLTPEPTLPQLEGIINDFAEKNDISIDVTQLDLRDPFNGKVRRHHYGNLLLPYINELVEKVYWGIDIGALKDVLESADVIGFTNNFAMSRRVVADYIAATRRFFPEKEIWVGGRDIYTNRIESVYADAANRTKLVIFNGHAIYSLPAYLLWRTKRIGQPFGITTYNQGEKKTAPPRPLTDFAITGKVHIPLPVYHHPQSLGYFTGSGEGQPNPPFGRFVHMSLTIGCPYACGYCTTGYRERFLVCKEPEEIIRELELYRTLGVTTIAIMDDNLLCLGPQKINEVMNLINSYGFEIEFGNGLQLSLLNKYWDKIKDSIFANCVSLYAPLEDLTVDVKYEKLAPIVQELELMKRITDGAFPKLRYVTMGVIIGVPDHTKQALATNFLDNIQLFLDIFRGTNLEVAITVFNFMPLPGTTFGEEALNSGRMVVSDPISADPEVCSFGTTSYAPIGMTHQEVFALYEQALNLNPAGKKLGISYVALQRLGMKVLPETERKKIPAKWQISGFHLRAQVE